MTVVYSAYNAIEELLNCFYSSWLVPLVSVVCKVISVDRQRDLIVIFLTGFGFFWRRISGVEVVVAH